MAAVEPRSTRWVRTITAVLVAVPILLGGAVALLALRTLGSPGDLVVSGLAAVPALAGVVVRGRVLWLAGALPALRAELRSIEDGRPGAGPDAGDLPAAARGTASDAVTADDDAGPSARGRGRVTLRRVWRAARWLRSPAAQAGDLARSNLGPRAAATVATTTGAVERSVGLVALTLVAAIGSAVLAVAVVVLTVATVAA